MKWDEYERLKQNNVVIFKYLSLSYKIEFACHNKLRADIFRRIFSVIQFRIFFSFSFGIFRVKYLNTQNYNFNRIYVLADIIQFKMLKIIFGPKWEKIVQEWRSLENVELHNQYSPPNIIRMKHVEGMEQMGNALHEFRCKAGWKLLIVNL
jgi:hypothetical protein